MKIDRLITCVVVVMSIWQLSACVTSPQAFYMSPRHATANHYKTMPLRSDSVRSMTYAGGMLSIGSTNDWLRDAIFGAQGHLHRSHQLGRVTAFYGAVLSGGNYSMRSFENSFAGSGVDPWYLDSVAGNKPFGSYGLNGGISWVMPFPKGGEWRVIGIEGSLEREFGNYLRVRKNIPESAANLSDKNHFYPTTSVTTDFVGKLREGSIGYKIAYTRLLRSLEGEWSPGDDFRVVPQYMTHTLHLTIHEWTGYGQLNFGSHALHLQLGLSHRLERKKPAKYSLAYH